MSEEQVLDLLGEIETELRQTTDPVARRAMLREWVEVNGLLPLGARRIRPL